MAANYLAGVQKQKANFRFVIPEGLDETSVTDALAEAFSRCREADMGPAWVEESAVLNVSPTKTVTFIHGELVSSSLDSSSWILNLSLRMFS